MTVPFRSAVVKVTARCNLNCTYCYMFNQADKTFSRVPANMRSSTALLLLQRIREHLLGSNERTFNLVLHGGEPTLWPLDSFRQFFAGVKSLRQDGFDIRVSLQTNGFHLRDELLDLLAENRITLGISIDGPPSFNDLARVRHDGKGSYRAVLNSVQHIIDRGLGNLIGGFLCVANPTIPPSILLDWINELPVRRLDLLWPMEFNYDRPPWSGGDHALYHAHPRYGVWFADVFAEWWRRDDPKVFVRLFYETILVLLGSQRHSDMIVNDTIDMFVVNTDGAIEYHDYFRSHHDGATRTRFNLHNNGLKDIAQDELFEFCLNLKAHLPVECSSCEAVRVCGGGFLPGRTKSQSALPSRRSVLCYDQFEFYARVSQLVRPHVRDTGSALLDVVGTGPPTAINTPPFLQTVGGPQTSILTSIRT
jgi:uncharacterized protein